MANNNKNLSDKLLWALSDDAKAALKLLEENGLDRDLAISLLETLCSEEKLYDLPKDEDNEIL